MMGYILLLLFIFFFFIAIIGLPIFLLIYFTTKSSKNKRMNYSAPYNNTPAYNYQSQYNQSLPMVYNEKLPYSRKKCLLTYAEFLFYKALFVAIEGKAIIMCKVRIVDFINITEQHRSRYMSMFQKISQKHIDFLICDTSMVPILAIELNDKTHYNPDTIQRDNFIKHVYYSAQMPFITFWVQNNYNIDNIKSIIRQYIYL